MKLMGDMWPMHRDTIRRDGLLLFSKLIRTKNVEALQEQSETPRIDNGKQKLTVFETKLSFRWV